MVPQTACLTCVDQTHGTFVEPALAETGHAAVLRAEGGREQHHHGSNRRRDATAKQHTTEYVAAELVDAQQVRRRRSLQPLAHVLFDWIEPRDNPRHHHRQ